MHAADLLSKRAELTPDRIALVEVETGLADRTAAMDKRAAREVTVTFRK